MAYALCISCGLRQPTPEDGSRKCSSCKAELVAETGLARGGLLTPAPERPKVIVEVVEGTAKGEARTFDRHDTLLCGREPDCHIHLTGDPAISRHHFFLEVNPPHARLRDLGSRNGTFVNGTRHGKRELGETPEQGARHQFPEVDLKNGDQLRVGKTLLRVRIDVPLALEDQHTEIVPDSQRILCSRCGRGLTVAPADLPPLCPDCKAAPAADPMKVLVEMVDKAAPSSKPSFTLPGYKIDKRVGQGGFGVVYLARRHADGGAVAIKVMLSQVAVDDASRDGFRREIDVLRKLEHPNIVRFFEHGSAGDAFYFVMDYCEGGSVWQEMKKGGGKLPFDRATGYVLDSLEGMAYAHDQGYIHRDLKPHNLLLSGPAGKRIARVSDFGLAKSFENAGLSGMTLTGAAAGSPDYMPREQVTNFRDVKPASDVWSMAAAYYEMLAGVPPRGRLKGQDPIVAVLQTEIIPIHKVDPAVPKSVAKVLERALHSKPKSRYSDAGEFRDALRKAL